ncbi:MAG TPA: deoxynucleoside kinase [Anaerolineae bacterium]|nr:deoxynucleoside kinase [Anaerolineae bacterium]
MRPYFIIVAGNIGVGKSTLVELLTQKLGWQPVYEAVADNPYLADFYDDMPRWSFHSQIYFLSRRLQQHHALRQRPTPVIQDRSLYEDAEIFARNLYQQGHMRPRDWDTYYDLYQTMTTMLPTPDLVVYLRADVTTLQRRIGQRGRTYEKKIPDTYLQQLNNLYDDWIERFNLSPTLTVDTNPLDYVQHSQHLERIWGKIEERLHGRDYLDLTTD